MLVMPNSSLESDNFVLKLQLLWCCSHLIFLVALFIHSNRGPDSDIVSADNLSLKISMYIMLKSGIALSSRSYKTV